MKLSIQLSLAATTAILLTSCETTDSNQDRILSGDQQTAFLSNPKPPQLYGYNVMRAGDGGIMYIGNAGLHPNHFTTENFIKDTIPMIKVEGRTPHKKMNVLIDPSSPDSWVEFSKAQLFDAKLIGINDQLIPYRGGFKTDAPAYACIITQLRIDKLFIENTPFYVRLATGSMGPLARGISDPRVDAVLGYETLQLFEYIQIDLRNRAIQFSATKPYTPHENLVLTRASIVPVEDAGLAVQGSIFGQDTPIILDVTGNYHFAMSNPPTNTTKQVSIGNVVARQVPTIPLPGADMTPRAGRQMLFPYVMTICPKEGIVYFERPPTRDGSSSNPKSPDEAATSGEIGDDLFEF